MSRARAARNLSERVVGLFAILAVIAAGVSRKLAWGLAIMLAVVSLSFGWALPAMADSEGNSTVGVFESYTDASKWTIAVDYYTPNCWELRAKNISAYSYNYYWWYYDHWVSYGNWNAWESVAAEAKPVTVFNYGQTHYCSDPDNDCSGEPTSTSVWYGNRDGVGS